MLTLFHRSFVRSTGELKALNYLTELDLSGNRLSGTIPDVIGDMTSLNFLMLQDNKLTGQLPQSIGNLVSAQEIVLSRNKLEGRLPANIGHLEKLRGLKVDHNLLTGPLPDDWKQKGISKYISQFESPFLDV